MTSDSEFNTIRPYCDSEIEAAIERLCKSEEFLTLFTHLTKMDRATIQGALQGIRSRAEFQAKFFGPAIQSLINTTTDGITVSGMELVDKNTSYIFMSNHRDIILDSAILNVLLRQHGNKYTRAAIGSNLLINDWVTDLVKLDSCFVIERDITVREMLTSSSLRKNLSSHSPCPPHTSADIMYSHSSYRVTSHLSLIHSYQYTALFEK